MSKQHETSDSYHGEIVRRGSHRAIICRDGIQYIIQQSRKVRAGSTWRAVGYCTTKKALIRLSVALEPLLVPELEALPDHAHQNWAVQVENPAEFSQRAA
ncbi:hypothetical protein [uncultured Roseovarius sp.]|uniref:hypothetical protein n=1 Tax=uncultured Roseovarius sp. TaxID=293344 RepID=UPI0026346F79|nr:hypothetical protein [uncultured Roseovarius sp.]